MCGIVGTYNMPQAPIENMGQKLAHRGPDAHATFIQPPVQMAHRRLAIIDTESAANQPMTKNGLTICFNGEIYNYRQLAQQLTSQGISLDTDSDTEVLLQCWRFWGSRALNKLRGMFSFAVYEHRSQALYLARDPFGIKPLFIHEQNGRLAFASEIKALLPVLEHNELDPKALIEHLVFLWVSDDDCIYQQINKLPAGHYAVIKPNEASRVIQYSDVFEPSRATRTISYDDAVSELQNTLDDSVKAHLVADVPVALQLSGGLDSSLIAAIAREHQPDIEAYTIRFRSEDQAFEAMPDDAYYARQVAHKLNIPLHEMEISPQIVDLWPKLVRSMDEPIGDAAAINSYLICQSAYEQGTKVLLSGMGADELFAGYRKHYACQLAARLRRFTPNMLHKALPHIARAVPVAGQKRGYRYLRWLKRFLAFAGLDEEAAFRQSYSYYSPEQLKHMLTPQYHRYIQHSIEQHQALFHYYSEKDFINRMCYIDSQWFLRGLNLAYCDRSSMAASTEVRVPFVDREVANLALRLPGRYKIKKGRTKALLKDAARHWLPDSVIDRPKAGFAAPMRSWIRHDLKTMVDDLLLSDQGFAARGIMRREQIAGLVEADRRGRSDNAQQVWQLLTLEIWLQQHEGRL